MKAWFDFYKFCRLHVRNWKVSWVHHLSLIHSGLRLLNMLGKKLRRNNRRGCFFISLSCSFSVEGSVFHANNFFLGKIMVMLLIKHVLSHTHTHLDLHIQFLSLLMFLFFLFQAISCSWTHSWWNSYSSYRSYWCVSVNL